MLPWWEVGAHIFSSVACFCNSAGGAVRRVALLAATMLATRCLISCGSCPAPDVEVGDRVRVVIGPAENPDDVPCDSVGFGVGAEFIGEIAETNTLGPIDSGPWPSGCVAPIFTG